MNESKLGYHQRSKCAEMLNLYMFFPKSQRLNAVNRFKSPAESAEIFKATIPAYFLYRFPGVLEHGCGLFKPDLYEVLIGRGFKNRFKLPDQLGNRQTGRNAQKVKVRFIHKAGMQYIPDNAEPFIYFNFCSGFNSRHGCRLFKFCVECMDQITKKKNKLFFCRGMVAMNFQVGYQPG